MQDINEALLDYTIELLKQCNIVLMHLDNPKYEQKTQKASIGSHITKMKSLILKIDTILESSPD